MPENPADAARRNTLYCKQCKMLRTLLAHGAISRAQYEKSFNGLTEKLYPAGGAPALPESEADA